ncbi:hypothetical protein FBEOM_3415 [Fusarium beomiforme]|uniref:Uncharacterized protein n=1 Tax=Fusarium beomiforme TaxID=44412 RepID=A0A9P5DZ26_9HYPO|nr:hypothetical protein FBEOM_3415 [Fusarium beomiforme]
MDEDEDLFPMTGPLMIQYQSPPRNSPDHSAAAGPSNAVSNPFSYFTTSNNYVTTNDGHLVVKGPAKEKIKARARRTYPAVLPDPDEAMLICYFYTCGAYAKSRDQGVHIKSPTELGPSEIDCLSQHLRSFESSHPKSHQTLQLIKFGDLHCFLTAVFYHWNTSKPIGAKPVLPEETLDDHGFKLGTLRRNIGPIIDENGLTHEDGRRKSDFVYIALEINKGGDHRLLTDGGPIWKDKHGNRVNQEDVEIFSFMQHDPRACRRVCFHHFDTEQTKRIMGYN